MSMDALFMTISVVDTLSANLFDIIPSLYMQYTLLAIRSVFMLMHC